MKKDLGLAILRIGTATLLLTHGVPKFLKLIAGGEIEFGNPIGIGATASFVLAVIAEFFCSILILVGFKTRWATILPILVMLTAGFIVHAQDPFGRKEKAFLFLVMLVAILILGPGKFSIDRKN
ncbi:MAG: DoxX family protein [Aurantibacter sp.]